MSLRFEKVMDPKDAAQMNALQLAYIGDSVFDLKIKEYMVAHHNMPVEKFHQRVSKIVCARNQSSFIDEWMENLDETEKDIYNRGRNASVHTKAKNATMAEYKKATGLEALIGYLYLKGNMDRVLELMKIAVDFLDS